MKVKVSLLLIIIMLSLQGRSQTKWSLEDCINYAHANNIQVKRQEMQADLSKNNYFQSKMNILPSVNAGFDRTYYFGRHLDQGTNTIIENNSITDYMGVQANVDLFAGLQNYNRIKMNEFSMLAKLQDVEKEKIQLTFNIATAYLDILFKKELLQVSTSQLGITALQVDRTKKLVDAGSAAKGDLLVIQAQQASEKLNVTNAQNDLKLSYLNLTQFLDLDSVGGFEIVLQDTINVNFLSPISSEMDVYYKAMEFLPQIKSAEYQLNSLEKDLAVQKGKLSPVIYANGAYGTRYSSDQQDALNQNYSKQFDVNRNQTIGVGVSIPIFNKWQVKNSISNAKVQVNDAEYQLSQLKQQLYKEIQQAHNDAVSSREKYNSAVEAVSSLKESFNYTEQKYNVGIVNSVEYNIAKNNYIKAQSDLLQAKYQYIFAVKILDFYRGIPISL
jgi:outer membrane protein